MATNTTYFWDGNRLYGQAEVVQTIRSFMRSGLGTDENGNINCGKVTNSGLTISVAPLIAMVDGVFCDTKSDSITTTLTETKPSNYSRVDRVVVRADFGNKNCYITIKQGTEASNPVPPTLTKNSGNIYEISLARITVGTDGSVSVTDERYTPSVCGAIRARGQSEFEQYFQNNVKGRFETWFANAETSKRYIFVQDGQPPASGDTVTPKDGDLWVCTRADDTSAGLYQYSDSGWTKISTVGTAEATTFTAADGTHFISQYLPPSFYGVTINGDYVAMSSKLDTMDVPLSKALPNYSSNTAYANLSSNGVTIIKKSGYYDISGFVNVSDNAGGREVGVLIYADDIVIAETWNTAGGNNMTVSCTRDNVYLSAGTKLTLNHHFTGTNGLLRIGIKDSQGRSGDATCLTIRPLYIP